MASKNDDFDIYLSSSYDVSEGGTTRKMVNSRCHTEEVEPGRFIRKCQKAEQTLKDCVGRPTEIVGYNQVYTEKDVTDQMVQGSFSLPIGISVSSEAAEEMKKFFNVGSRVPTKGERAIPRKEDVPKNAGKDVHVPKNAGKDVHISEVGLGA